ncbi:fumarylacetoacetate hydrolase domain-containing protein 2 [Bacillus canaveralius]|uniref:Fumarylacetoacetate hydrolase domain-containing protein 2 n=1 Tax=Bacillus canaveralius TaxID=1403243 RepID=A0A2N5GMA4_9BACI|nr:fumarylacetoacetate hydrolase family protein [Bacillus canaveralius]PLR82989.1 fumarylacetoacetate hydrolase domain-containing protein 2 [Bacillus canaveralius]PLR97007.1 fumarylacetoacetate hydrolase domain-containing protein 2 [Bacillus canaveralius]
MKLISYQVNTQDGPKVRIGAVQGSNAIDLSAAYRLELLARGLNSNAAERLASALLPGDMVAFIENGEAGLDAAQVAISAAVKKGYETGPNNETIIFPLEDAKLLSPITRPPMLRDFMAFETHLKNIYPKLGKEIPPEWYEMPAYYKGNPSSLSTHGDEIPMPSYAQELDFEFELAIIIGRGGKNIPREDALSHVFGYTIYNDFSARKIQSKEIAIGLGPSKGKDFTNGHTLGPWIVTADEIPDIYNMAMKAKVNNEVWCDDNSGSIYWKFEDLVAHASMGEYLQVGEVLGTGTIGWGSGAEREKFLYPGDEVELEVEGIGILKNRIVAENS